MQLTRKRIAIIASAAVALVLAVAAIGIGLQHKTLTIKVGDAYKTVSTWAPTPRAALAAANVHVGDHDAVYPESGKRLSDGDTVTVKPASAITVKDDQDSSIEWVASDSLLSMVGEQSQVRTITVSDCDRELPFTVSTQNVAVSHDGKVSDVTFEPSKTVSQNLQAAGVKLSPLDRLELVDISTVDGATELKKDTRANPVAHGAAGAAHPAAAVKAEDRATTIAALSVTRVERVIDEKETVTEAPVEQRDDDSLYEGQQKVIQEGSDGVVVERVMKEKVNGTVVKETTLSTQTKSELKKRIVAKGTKERPAGGATPGRGTGSAPAGSAWAALAQCESGGNPATNSGNGYYGMYQFNLGTWRSVGGTGLPSDASAAEQTKRAQILQQRAGWGQWPACARSLGLY